MLVYIYTYYTYQSIRAVFWRRYIQRLTGESGRTPATPNTDTLRTPAPNTQYIMSICDLDL